MEKYKIIAALEASIEWADLIHKQANENIDAMNGVCKHVIGRRYKKMPHMPQPTMDRQKQVLKEAKEEELK